MHARLLLLLFLLPACTRPCAPGAGTPVRVYTLYFGLAIEGRGDVTSDEWRTFQNDTITANLGDGYTLLDATGAWMNPAKHQTVQEASKVLVAALPDEPASLITINRIRSAYQARFHQQLVGMTSEPACATF